MRTFFSSRQKHSSYGICGNTEAAAFLIALSSSVMTSIWASPITRRLKSGSALVKLIGLISYEAPGAAEADIKTYNTYEVDKRHVAAVCSISGVDENDLW